MTGIQVQEDEYGTRKVKAVETNRGTIRTNTVVNSAGTVKPQNLDHPWFRQKWS